jgi:hypothetical protein
MSKAGEKMIEGAKEALAFVRGEGPAASIYMHGHHYVPREAVTIAVLDERERCARAGQTAAQDALMSGTPVKTIPAAVAAAIRGDAPSEYLKRED